MLGLFSLWLIYPVYKIRGEALRIQTNGGAVDNRYNFAGIKGSGFIQQAEALPPGAKVYSNYEPAAWFYLRRDILSIPRLDVQTGAIDSASLAIFLDSIQSNGDGYLVWFKSMNYRGNLPSLAQLHQIIKMEQIYSSDVGDIYRITTRNP